MTARSKQGVMLCKSVNPPNLPAGALWDSRFRALCDQPAIELVPIVAPCRQSDIWRAQHSTSARCGRNIISCIAGRYTQYDRRTILIGDDA